MRSLDAQGRCGFRWCQGRGLDFRDAWPVSEVSGRIFSRRGAWWAACGAVAVVVVGGGAASLISIVAGSDPFPVLGQVSWWTAAVVFLLVAGLGCGWGRPTVRRFVFTSIGAAAAYVVAGSALVTLDAIGTADPRVAGSGWGSAMEGAAVFALGVYGNGVVAVVAPLALGLLHPFRAAVVGQPATWSNRPFTPHDDDAAAEDFNIF